MVAKKKMNSINKTARVAGLLGLLVIVLGIFAQIVRSNLIAPGDTATTANNIMDSEMLFRVGFLIDLIHYLCLLLLPLALYMLLKAVNKKIAVLMVVLVLVGVPIAMFNMLNQIAALLILSNADYLIVFPPEQLHAQVMLFLNLHEYGVFIAQIFWGLWLFPLGYLVFKSGYIPKILGILLIIAGFGYLIDVVIFFLFPTFDVTISQFTFIGELLLALWLLIKGVNVEEWEKIALESA